MVEADRILILERTGARPYVFIGSPIWGWEEPHARLTLYERCGYPYTLHVVEPSRLSVEEFSTLTGLYWWLSERHPRAAEAFRTAFPEEANYPGVEAP